MKKIFLALLMILLAAGAALADDLFEVTLKARGSSEEEALTSAIDEAIRRSLGSIFAERSELGGEMLEEKLIQFSRGTATNYKILESSSDESGVVLTVLVTVNSAKLKENARTYKEGTGKGGMGQRQTPKLEAGQQKFAAFLKNLRYETFLDVSLEDKQTDARKGLLNVTVLLSFNRQRYLDEFVDPLTQTLSEIFAASLREEIEGEYESPDDRFAASFHVLGENFSSRSWELPRVFYEALKRDARFWDTGKGQVQTHKRLWLHFSLLGADGSEIERLPIHLAVSNVLFFSELRKESSNPWFFSGMEETGRKNSFILTAAPYFGATDGKGYGYYESFKQSFAFRLPEELLSRVSDVKASLELERQ